MLDGYMMVYISEKHDISEKNVRVPPLAFPKKSVGLIPKSTVRIIFVSAKTGISHWSHSPSDNINEH